MMIGKMSSSHKLSDDDWYIKQIEARTWMSYCNFDKEIVTLINSDTSQLMCVRIDEARKKVNFIN